MGLTSHLTNLMIHSAIMYQPSNHAKNLETAPDNPDSNFLLLYNYMVTVSSTQISFVNAALLKEW